MENAVLPYEHTYVPMVVYAIPFIILVMVLFVYYVRTQLQARILKLNAEIASRPQTSESSQPSAESTQEKKFTPLTVPTITRKPPYVLILVVIAGFAGGLSQIHTVRITAQMFECRYLLGKKNIEIPISNISRIFQTQRRGVLMLTVQTTDGNSTKIETDDAGKIQSIVESLKPTLTASDSASPNTSATLGALSPASSDWNGLRLRSPESAPIFIVFDGSLHWIPNPTTYNNLFKDWNGILSIENLGAKIGQGPNISEDAMLAEQNEGGKVFLITNDVKHWIVNPNVFDRYNFNWGRVRHLPATILESIPSGSNLN
jgi:hypothetical protein